MVEGAKLMDISVVGRFKFNKGFILNSVFEKVVLIFVKLRDNMNSKFCLSGVLIKSTKLVKLNFLRSIYDLIFALLFNFKIYDK